MEIVVIGGGIAGLSAAAALAADAQVTVLEREDALGYHASGRSAAMFVENYGNAVVTALNRASRPVLERFEVLSPRGLLALAMEDEAAAFDADIEALELCEISLAEAHSLVPILLEKVVRAATYADAHDIDTDRLMQHLARELRAHGGKVCLGVDVSEIAWDGAWKIRAGQETLRADVVVNAAGAWADDVARLAGVLPVGLQPYRRSMARLPAPGGHDVRNWPMMMGQGETWYAKPDAGAWIVSPAEADPVEPMDAWADDMVLAEGIARYQPYVTEEVRRIEANWAGLRTFAPDQALVIGEAGRGGFFWMAGQGGYGFQTAPAASALLADLVLGRAPGIGADVAKALSPERFQTKSGV